MSEGRSLEKQCVINCELVDYAVFGLTDKYVAIYYDDSKTYAWLNGFVAKHTPDIMFLQINENSHLFL